MERFKVLRPINNKNNLYAQIHKSKLYHLYIPHLFDKRITIKKLKQLHPTIDFTKLELVNIEINEV